MNVKAVVKVMNFHALLRVDSSGRRANRYNTMEQELAAMMRIIQSNQNLKLDKHIKLPDPSLPKLRIYIGSDLGFCGSVNTGVSNAIREDKTSEKIVVGRKLHRPSDVSLYLTRESYDNEFDKVRSYIERAVRERCWSAIELVYNHYYNVSSVKLVEKKIYPLELKEASEDELKNCWDDFEIEGDARNLLELMTISCLLYEVRIAAVSAYASENIMRQNATTESLKKLDEIEVEQRREERKKKTQESFRKTIDSFVKQKSLGV